MIQSLNKGLQVLGLLAERGTMSATDLARELEVDKSTVSRILTTLRGHDLVQIDQENKKYKLGYRILHWGEMLKNNINVIAISKPYLMQLSSALKESVHLCSFSNGGVYVLDQVRSNKAYALSATVGMVEPLHSSAVGKCILAYRSSEMIQTLLDGYDFLRYTEKTIMDSETLLRELEQIRKKGYAVDDEEMSIGVRCLAVPIFNYRKSVRYGIGISGPRDQILMIERSNGIQLLIRTAKQISTAIGYGNNW